MENLTTQVGELFAAIQRSDIRQVKRLIAAQVSPNQRGADGRTALMVAFNTGHPEIIRTLCSAAATSHPPAHLFLENATTIGPGQAAPSQPLPPFTQPAAALATTPSPQPSYSTIIYSAGIEAPPTDYISEIPELATAPSQTQTTAASSLLEPAANSAGTDTESRANPRTISHDTVSNNAVSSNAISSNTVEHDLETLAVEALLRGDINKLPALANGLTQGSTDDAAVNSSAASEPSTVAAGNMLAEIEAIVRPIETTKQRSYATKRGRINQTILSANGLSSRAPKKVHTPPVQSTLETPTPIERHRAPFRTEAYTGKYTSDDARNNSRNDAREDADNIEAKPSSRRVTTAKTREPRSQISAPPASTPPASAPPASAPKHAEATSPAASKNALKLAVEQNESSQVVALIKAGVDFRPATWYDTPVLVTAAGKGYAQIVQILINAGANVNNGYEHLPLHIAASNGHLEVVHRLLNAGALINEQEEGGRTALFAAAAAGHLRVVQVLMDRGANPHLAYQGETAIMLAERNGHQSVYAYLYKRLLPQSPLLAPQGAIHAAHASMTPPVVGPAEIPAVQSTTRQPTPAAKVNPHPTDAGTTRSRPTVSEAITPTPQAAHVQHETLPATHAVVERPQPEHSAFLNEQLVSAAAEGRLPILRDLIAAGAAVNTVNDNGCSALSSASRAGRMSILETLLDAQADPNLPEADSQGNRCYPLMVAARSASSIHRADILELLILQGANIDQADSQGRTAMMHAVEKGHLDAIATLINHNANLLLRDTAGQTALMQAKQHHNREIVQVLQQAEVSQQQAVKLLKAVTFGNLAQVQQLLSAGINPNATADDMSALSQAAAKGYLEIAQCLIAAGAEVDYRSANAALNPLLYAAYRGHLEMVQLLLAKGADVQATTSGKLDAIAYAKQGQQQRRNVGKPFDAIIALLENHP
ncbi:MAG: ankyrin repeat domain-containing protein [Cyanobacteria bacterium J06597_16]